MTKQFGSRISNASKNCDNMCLNTFFSCPLFSHLISAFSPPPRRRRASCPRSPRSPPRPPTLSKREPDELAIGMMHSKIADAFLRVYFVWVFVLFFPRVFSASSFVCGSDSGCCLPKCTRDARACNSVSVSETLLGFVPLNSFRVLFLFVCWRILSRSCCRVFH